MRVQVAGNLFSVEIIAKQCLSTKYPKSCYLLVCFLIKSGRFLWAGCRQSVMVTFGLVSALDTIRRLVKSDIFRCKTAVKFIGKEKGKAIRFSE